MNKVLIRWEDNWADKMDIEGATIVTIEEAEEIKTNLMNRKREFSIGIGTNEDIEYDNGKALLNVLSFDLITDEEEKTLNKYMNTGTNSFIYYCVEEEQKDE